MKPSSLLSTPQLLYQVAAVGEAYRQRLVEAAAAVEEERLPLILGAEEGEAAAEELPQGGLVEAVAAAAEGGLLQKHRVGEAAEEEGVVRRLHPGHSFHLPALRRSWWLLLLLLLPLLAVQVQST